MIRSRSAGGYAGILLISAVDLLLAALAAAFGLLVVLVGAQSSRAANLGERDLQRLSGLTTMVVESEGEIDCSSLANGVAGAAPRMRLLNRVGAFAYFQTAGTPVVSCSRSIASNEVMNIGVEVTSPDGRMFEEKLRCAPTPEDIARKKVEMFSINLRRQGKKGFFVPTCKSVGAALIEIDGQEVDDLIQKIQEFGHRVP